MLVMERRCTQASGPEAETARVGSGAGVGSAGPSDAAGSGAGTPDMVGEEFPGAAVVSSRDFNQNLAAAKREAADRPVIVTDRGEPAYVLLSVEEYRRLRGRSRSLYEVFSTPMPGWTQEDMDNLPDIDFEVERFPDLVREVDFSDDALGYERRL